MLHDPAYTHHTPEELDALLDRHADRIDGEPWDARWMERVTAAMRSRYQRPNVTPLPRTSDLDRKAA